MAMSNNQMVPLKNAEKTKVVGFPTCVGDAAMAFLWFLKLWDPRSSDFIMSFPR